MYPEGIYGRRGIKSSGDGSLNRTGSHAREFCGPEFPAYIKFGMIGAVSTQLEIKPAKFGNCFRQLISENRT